MVEGNLLQSLPDRRLPGVAYRTLKVGSTWLLNSRLHDWYSLWLSFRSAACARKLPALLEGFAPEAVLAVAHGHLWVTAAEFAEQHGLPLHLIVHDDWPRVARPPAPFSGRIDQQFRRVYRAAASRLCVSPFMADDYRQRYGVEAQVLYPSRGQDAETFDGPPDRLQDNDRGLVCAFAGTINTPDYCRMLRILAECLEKYGGRLLIFGPMTVEQARTVGLDRPSIHFCGLLKSNELMNRLRSEVDVLFVPMSFAASDRANMEISFPSKLTDYTAVGLPMLVFGPAYCSAVRWARENRGVAEVVDTDDPVALDGAIRRLSNSPEHRVRLATAALTIGERFFSHAAGQSGLQAALLPARAA